MENKWSVSISQDNLISITVPSDNGFISFWFDSDAAEDAARAMLALVDVVREKEDNL